MDNKKLIEAVHDQLLVDISNGDSTVLAELLRFVPRKNLVGALSEDHPLYEE